MHMHKWKWHDLRYVEVYEHGVRDLPYKTVTELSGSCTRCGTPRVKKILGRWSPPKYLVGGK